MGTPNEDATYKELTMREAYTLFVAGLDVERRWPGSSSPNEDSEDWGSLRHFYGGELEWKEFAECYEEIAGIQFRVEVE